MPVQTLSQLRRFAQRLLLVLAAATSLTVHAYDAVADLSDLERSVQAAHRLSAGDPRKNKVVDRIQILVENIMKGLKGNWKTLGALDPELKKLQAQQIKDQVHQVYQLAVQVGVGVPYIRILDPTKPATGDNVRFVEMSYSADPGAVTRDLLQLTDQRSWFSKQADKAGQALKPLGNTAMSFGVQTVYFEIAQGLFSVAMLGVNYKDNPMALQQFLTNSLSPEGILSLGMFMAVNHPVAQMLYGLRAGYIPPTMIPFISMGAATLLSSLGMDLYSDTDFRACAASFSKVGQGIDEDACEKTQRRWLLSGKIMQYAPQITGMMASVALSSMTSLRLGGQLTAKAAGGAVKGLEDAAIEGRRVKWVLTGAKVLRNVGTAISLATDFTPLGAAVTIGELVIFFTWDQVVEQPLSDALDEFRLANFDVKAWMDQNGSHFDFDHRKDFSQQPVADAFDVMATNLAGAQMYLNKLTDKFQKDYQALEKPVADCVPENQRVKLPALFQSDYLRSNWIEDLAATFLPGPYGNEQRHKMSLRMWVNKLLQKSDAQLDCEVTAQPVKLLNRFHEVNTKWRNVLLSGFTRAGGNWSAMIDGFNANFTLASAMVDVFGIHKLSDQTSHTRTVMNREVLEALIGHPVPPSSNHPENLGFVDTKDVADYVIASLACGNKVRALNAWEQFGQSVQQLFGKATQGSGFMTTPWGSSVNFEPPNVTTGDGTICFNGSVDEQKARSASNGPWIDERGRTYTSLYTYVYENLDPAIWQSQPGHTESNVANWWGLNVLDRIAGVWDSYRNSYQQLMHDELRPALFTRVYRTGCDANDSVNVADAGYNPDDYDDTDGLVAESEDNETFEQRQQNYAHGVFGVAQQRFLKPALLRGEKLCSAPDDAYKVGNGIMISLEIEVRQYLRALTQILAVDRAGFDRGRFLFFANELLLQIRETSRAIDGLASGEFIQRQNVIAAKLGDLTELVNAEIGYDPNGTTPKPTPGSRDDLRQRLALTIMKNLRDAMGETGSYASWITLVQLGNSPDNSAPVVPQTVNRPRRAGILHVN